MKRWLSVTILAIWCVACGGTKTITVAPPPPAPAAVPPKPPSVEPWPPKPEPKPTPVMPAPVKPAAPVAPKPEPIATKAPVTAATITPTLLSIMIESVSAKTMTGIDYETWPEGDSHVVNLPLPCDKAQAVPWIHVMLYGVQQKDGSWTISKCED